MAVCRVVHGPHADGSGECHVGVASMGRLPKRSAFVRALDARAPRGGEPLITAVQDTLIQLRAVTCVRNTLCNLARELDASGGLEHIHIFIY